MGGFLCPKCQMVRHIDEDDNDPRLDHCWFCGTVVPYTDAELQRFKDEGLIDSQATETRPVDAERTREA